MNARDIDNLTFWRVEDHVDGWSHPVLEQSRLMASDTANAPANEVAGYACHIRLRPVRVRGWDVWIGICPHGKVFWWAKSRGWNSPNLDLRRLASAILRGEIGEKPGEAP